MNEQLAEIESDLIFKQQLNLAEHNIYGSSRLGVKRDTSQLHFSRFTASSIDTITGAIIKDSILYQSNGQVDSLNTQRVLAYKSYELSNHLGNVLAVVSDKRIYISDTIISGDTFALWDAHITSAQDYYPFGMLMPNRHWVESDSSGYKYGFNGQERDDEVNGIGNSYTATYWQYDTRLGRRWNQDPKPNPSISNYAVFAGNPIWFTDVLGDTPTTAEAATMVEFTYNLRDSYSGSLRGSTQKDGVTLMGGWIGVSQSTDKESGFKSALFSRKLEDGTNEYALVFAGTDDWGDVKTDLGLYFGERTQMNLALDLAEENSTTYLGSELTFIGHSLGGWLASGSALKTGNPAITFNAPGISSGNRNTYELNKTSTIKAFVVQGEILNLSLSPFGFGATGEVTTLSSNYAPVLVSITSIGILYNAYQSGINHTTNALIESLKQNAKWEYEAKNYPPIKDPRKDLILVHDKKYN